MGFYFILFYFMSLDDKDWDVDFIYFCICRIERVSLTCNLSEDEATME